ncbi:MAG: Uma2 family endonuclease [Treponema sp.]|jgi:Uma2 family endonuclease|nr:Uma2 family endonuclease [Treponema sp.]
MSEAAEITEVKTCYAYGDYLETDDDYRAEIIDGHLYAMSPPSSTTRG